MGSVSALFHVAVRFRLAPPFPRLVLLVEIVPPAGDRAVLLATCSGEDRLAKLLSAIHGDQLETRRRIPDLLDLVAVEGATPDQPGTVASKYRARDN